MGLGVESYNRGKLRDKQQIGGKAQRCVQASWCLIAVMMLAALISLMDNDYLSSFIFHFSFFIFFALHIRIILILSDPMLESKIQSKHGVPLYSYITFHPR